MTINSSATNTKLSPSTVSGRIPGYSGVAPMDSFAGHLNMEIKATAIAHSNLPLDHLLKPTFEDMEKLSEEVSDALLEQFHQSGIPTKPQIDIIYNIEKNDVEIKGDREDLKEIKELIESDPELLEKVRTLNAVASHVCEMPEHLAFQKEYLESADPEKVIMKYSHLFRDERNQHELTFKFDTNGINIYYDGEYWVYF